MSEQATVAGQFEPDLENHLPVHLVVVTGLSGAGKSTALHALEDLGFYCVDNLPPPVFLATIAALRAAEHKKIAVCMDIRARIYLSQVVGLIAEAKTIPGAQAELLFLDAPHELLARRYSATRRPHPLSRQANSEVRAVMDGIVLEAELLTPLREVASYILDTAGLSVHDLRREVIKMFSLSGPASSARMYVRIVSFGFKYGIPHDADMLFDVRFLPNPFFVPGLRALSGKDTSVADFVLNQPDCPAFTDRVLDLLYFCLPKFEVEGKSYLTIAVGCTGGRHRSVALVEWFAEHLSVKLALSIDAVHRDMRRSEHLGADALAEEIGISAGTGT